MIFRITISIIPLLAEIEAQTGVDFQGLRTVNPQADAAFDDFVLTRDNAPEAIMQIKVAANLLSMRFAAYLRIMEWLPEEVSYEVETENKNMNCRQITIFVREFFKASVLNWWYMTRNPGLAQSNATSAAAMLEVLDGMIRTNVCVRRLRMF